jgi:hypothetical protein
LLPPLLDKKCNFLNHKYAPRVVLKSCPLNEVQLLVSINQTFIHTFNVIKLRVSHEKWLSGYTHHTCGRRPEVRIPGVSSSALPMSALVMASLLYSPHLWQGSLRHELQLSVSHVLSPPASYIGLACQDGCIALRWINFESYDKLRKISSNFIKLRIQP